ncbi:MAG: PIN domain-containing protein [Clostridiales bacterium]|nr:PIN domain-containing protein [Clostridiales bacterium]MBQ1574514.1 PIN domain-containing protein [Clostridiales bacterium]
MKVLIDTNIMIDALTNRDGRSGFSATVIDLCAKQVIDGYVALHSISNMYYILRKQYSDAERRTILKRYNEILKVAEVGNDVVDTAINNTAISDYEDALQYACAETVGADYIVTRNIKDYEKAEIRAISPEELLKLLA